MIKLFPFISIMILIEVMVSRPVGAQIQMNLRDCLAYGFEHNPTLKAADYRVAASEEARKSVRADFFPSLSTTYSLNRLESQSAKGPTDTDYLDQDARNFSIRLSQVLYAGSRIVNSYDIAVIEKEKIMFDKALAELELAYNIEIMFFQLMGAEQDVKVALESVKNLEEGVKSARAYFKEDLISYAEVLTTEVDMENAQQKLSIAKNDVNRKRVALFSLMNMPVSETIGFHGELGFYSNEYESDFHRCWEIASKNRPDLESLALQVAIAEKEAATALGSYLPVVKLDLGYHDQNRDYDKAGSLIGGDFDRDQRNRYWSAGVFASWELFDGGRAWYKNQQSNITVKETREMIKATQLFIKEGIHKALFSIAEANRRTSGARVAVKAAKENFIVEKHRLGAGLTTIPLMLDAQIRLTRAQGNLTQAMLAYMLGRAELQFMLGESYKVVKNKGY